MFSVEIGFGSYRARVKRSIMSCGFDASVGGGGSITTNALLATDSSTVISLWLDDASCSTPFPFDFL